MSISKEPIRLRQRKLKDGKSSLYLDIYIDGKRSYEYLKLYLLPGTGKDVRAKNKETMLLAEAVRAQRVVALQNGRFSFSKARDKVQFFDYYESIIDYKKKLASCRESWQDWVSNLIHMKRYERNHNILLCNIDEKWVGGYRDYLLTDAIPRNTVYDNKEIRLSPNTALTYYRKLCACLNKAVDDGLIDRNPAKRVEGIKGVEKTRMYLTIDEVRILAATPCQYPEIKRAFLFSCLTGLRKSDIEKMTWSEIHQQGKYTRIIFKQKKTGGLEYLDISPEAVKLLSERRKDSDLVFPCRYSFSHVTRTLKRWTADAGINKHITFHCGRHTFATLMLDLGADLYTVSKLLGHRNIKTTQIYAKVLDKNKQMAVSLIPEIDIEK